MAPFFLSVVSAEDHWMFLSSHGGVTAGRRDADQALFPYSTDDKIRDQAEVSGGKTILRVWQGGKPRVWEPFSERGNGRFRVRRSIGKSVWGNQILWEEENQELGLVVRTGWWNSRQFGWIRRSWLRNTGRHRLRVEFLDGIQNLMPSGAGSEFQLRFSTLLDAYKRNELVPGSRLALFRLSAIPLDRPEPAESLSTTVAWSIGPGRDRILLSSGQLEAFRLGKTICAETDLCGQRGGYFVLGKRSLMSGQEIDWMIGADVGQGAAEVVQLRRLLKNPGKFKREVLQDIQEGTQELQRIVGGADGLQVSALPLGCARHYSNTLCNVMRGGIFPDGDRLSRNDLSRFIHAAVPAAAHRWDRWARALPETITYADLIRAVRDQEDSSLERACREYLPLTFSRRHGDPSRPWNRFTIPSRDASGRRILNYQGNWRDIFQNWEALAHSFPGFTMGMVTRFLNATTADGYNPYRITREGIDWEVPDPHDPWACIGYWGDHQIIYLLKLLEHGRRHDPRELVSLLNREIFAFANVPYRIRNYRSLVAHPKDTVVFDLPQEKIIQQRVRTRGAEGKLLWDRKGRVVSANLAEKLLIPLLAKLSNFIPGAGIWLNTQRPEWNDANNALVGQGASVVTLAYLRRYLVFLSALFADAELREVRLAREVATFLVAIGKILSAKRVPGKGRISEEERRRVVDLLGKAGEVYRERLYGQGFSNRKAPFPVEKLQQFFAGALGWVDATLRASRRPDGLYHSYNLIRFQGRRSLSVRPLYEMLEGQVAILSSGLLSPREGISLLRSLKRSAMYRSDQHSYLLYPNRKLPRFLERNTLPPGRVHRSRVLRRLLAEGNRQLVEKDAEGKVHFSPGIGNQGDLAKVLDQLAQHAPYRGWLKRERAEIYRIYEDLFDHQSFTGRSGTFYGYEGLGCIYWHMVSKLVLAVQELYFQAEKEAAPAAVRRTLARAYYDLRGGLGDAKAPQEYGAFPMEPYSHTPDRAGAKQPGLTGQVKEDILCRWGELGVFVVDGQIQIRPRLLRASEFCPEEREFLYYGPHGERERLALPKGCLAFTFCQTPFVYRCGAKNALVVIWSDGTRSLSPSLEVNPSASRAIFQRSGLVSRVEVCLDRKQLLGSVG